LPGRDGMTTMTAVPVTGQHDVLSSRRPR
jgi:hypothetical protein